MALNTLEQHFPEATPVPGLDFQNTRDPEDKADAWEALIAGQAKGGGLYVPDSKDLQSFDADFFGERSDFYDLSMSEISALLLRQFIPSEGAGGVSNKDLQAMMDVAHNFELPLEFLNEKTAVAWLSESRTASFKDFAARAIAQLMERHCERTQTPKNIVVATSGDTGVAIADAFGDSEWITVTVLYPDGKVSPVQEAQMIDAAKKYPNVQCLPVDGDFDKAQAFSKSMQFMRDLDPTDKNAISELKKSMQQQLNISLAEDVITDLSEQLQTLELASANSINIWRLLPQMTQYFVSYAKVVKEGKIKPGEEVVFVVPTGNVGHLMAGMYAKQLGLPVKKFVIGTNDNDIVTCAIRDSELNHHNLTRNDKDENEALATSSPSMDIADPSNLERLLSLVRDLSDPEAQLDLELLKTDTKSFVPGQDGIPLSKYGVTEKMRQYMDEIFYAAHASDEEVQIRIAAVFHHSKNRTLLDPHGAAGFYALGLAQDANEVDRDEDFVILLETAHPDKFPEAIAASGIPVPEMTHPVLKELDTDNPENPENVLDSVAAVVAKVKKIAEDSESRREA